MIEPWDTAQWVDELEEAARHAPRNTASQRAVRRAFGRRLRQASPEQMLALAQALIATGTPRNRWFAYELIHEHKPALHSLDAAISSS
jgi:hypothetical protein